MPPTSDPRPDLPQVLWEPPADVRERSRVGRFLRAVEPVAGRRFEGYDELWRWSVDEPDAFWASIWEHFEVGAGTRPTVALDQGRDLADASWFPGETLNYAEEALRGRGRPRGPALVARSQGEPDVAVGWDDLRDQVARCRAGLVAAGVGADDRVVAYVGNRVEAVVAFLATASLGALWAACPPEFGAAGAIGRLGQLEPTVLITVSGYRYGAKLIDRHREAAELEASMPALRLVVEVGSWSHPRPPSGPARCRWSELLARHEPLVFEQVAADHPLYVLFSSGTTGPPKAIVHGHGGIVVEHLKFLSLHLDLGEDDRFFWFTTTGWMMWNLLVSGLLVGATVVLFDGDPGQRDLHELWHLADDLDVTYFGTSAPFLLACRAAGLHPGADHDLTRLRGIGSTGAPLPAEGFRWVSERVSTTALLGSISGGTDVCTAFVGSVPMLPVRAGRIPCRCLGAGVEARDRSGGSVVGEPGELVVTVPLPSMPVGLLGDDDGTRLRATYFDQRPGVWTHGDWITVHADGSCEITGRSDATLNRGGVRLGTAELYEVVEDLAAVVDSLVVHLEDRAGPGRLVLFVVCAPGHHLDADLEAAIVGALRRRLSPRHVPDEIHAVAGVPRTRSGKKLEVPIKEILLGRAPSAVVAADAVDDPELLAAFVPFATPHHEMEEHQ